MKIHNEGPLSLRYIPESDGGLQQAKKEGKDGPIHIAPSLKQIPEKNESNQQSQSPSQSQLPSQSQVRIAHSLTMCKKDITEGSGPIGAEGSRQKFNNLPVDDFKELGRQRTAYFKSACPDSDKIDKKKHPIEFSLAVIREQTGREFDYNRYLTDFGSARAVKDTTHKECIGYLPLFGRCPEGIHLNNKIEDFTGNHTNSGFIITLSSSNNTPIKGNKDGHSITTLLTQRFKERCRPHEYVVIFVNSDPGSSDNDKYSEKPKTFQVEKPALEMGVMGQLTLCGLWNKEQQNAFACYKKSLQGHSPSQQTGMVFLPKKYFS